MLKKSLPLAAFIATMSSLVAGQQVPVTGLAGARFRVSDLAKARTFYGEVFGFQEKAGTAPGLPAFQINREQFIEFASDKSGELAGPLEIVYFGASNQPAAPQRDADGRRVEFVLKASGAPPFKPSEKSIADHLLHVGMGATDLDRAIAFYGEHLGCKESWRGPTPGDIHLVILRVPGPREDFIEFLRESGSPDHLCLDVPDVQRAYQTLIGHGVTMRNKPRIASNGHWVLNLTDPNGLRVELMEPRPAATPQEKRAER